MHTLGLIGCGGISGAHAAPKEPLTKGYGHLYGALGNPRMKLVGVADTSPESRQRFQSNWGAALPDARCYDGADAMFREVTPDFVDVCVRGPAHFPVMMQAIQAGPKAILLEKAPTCSLEEMDQMVAAARAKHIPITVSYSRHWSPVLLRLAELIEAGLIGEVKTVVGYCPGWLFSMCSHLTDMICQFAGHDPSAVTARGSVRQGMSWHTIENLPPGFEPEPHADVMAIEYAGGTMGIQIGAPGEHGWLYCDVIGTEGCLRAHWETVPPGDERAPVALDKEGKPIDLSVHGMPEPKNIFRVCYDQVADYLEGGPLPCCTSDDWMAVHEIGFAAVESILGAGVRVELPNKERKRKLYLL